MKPVPRDYKTTGEKVKEIILNWKGVFLHIEECLRASGDGDGSYEQNSLHDFISNRRTQIGKKVTANGHPTGYSFIRCKREEMWDHVVATLPPNIAVAMDKTPSIDFKRKKGQVSSSAKKKNHRASGSGSASEDGLEDDCDNDPRLNILLRLEMGFSRSEVSHKINELRHQIANNENQRVIHQKEKRECRKELMEIECALRKEGCDNFNEDDHWKDANADLQTTIRTMLDVND